MGLQLRHSGASLTPVYLQCICDNYVCLNPMKQAWDTMSLIPEFQMHMLD